MGRDSAATGHYEAFVTVRRIHEDAALYHVKARVMLDAQWRCRYQYVRGDISSLSYHYILDDGCWNISYFTLATSTPVVYFEFFSTIHQLTYSLTLSLRVDGGVVAVGSGLTTSIMEEHL